MSNVSPAGRAVAERVRNLTFDPFTASSTVATSADVRDAVAEAMAEHRCDHYTRRPGIAPLCRAVAAALDAAGVAVDSDEEVVISGGPYETRYLVLRALATGKTVCLPAALVDAYRLPAQVAGATLIEWDPATPFAGEAGIWVWHPAVGPLPEAIAPDAVVLADVLDASAPAPSSLRGLASLHDAGRLLILGAFGTESGLAAWNVAWFAGGKRLTAEVGALKQAMTICTPAPGQYAALAVLEGVTA
ncbi:MAG: hypothetical protein H6642_12240 [Caldilineaceae bacterium]|nr:hypothetical protein [Caldilineaceae bacterium]